MQPENAIADLATELAEELLAVQRSMATVESCTGGGIAHLITDIPGSSRWFERGFVTYSNEAKVEMVGVDSDLLDSYGTVSEEVAVAMAEGGIRFSEADFCVSVTGVAGPDGGTPDKPVGTVCFAWSDLEHETRSNRMHFDGNRQQVRNQSIAHALKGMLKLVRG